MQVVCLGFFERSAFPSDPSRFLSDFGKVDCRGFSLVLTKVEFNLSCWVTVAPWPLMSEPGRKELKGTGRKSRDLGCQCFPGQGI